MASSLPERDGASDLEGKRGARCGSRGRRAGPGRQEAEGLRPGGPDRPADSLSLRFLSVPRAVPHLASQGYCELRGPSCPGSLGWCWLCWGGGPATEAEAVRSGPRAHSLWPRCPRSAVLGSGTRGQTRVSMPAPTPGPGPASPPQECSRALSVPAGAGLAKCRGAVGSPGGPQAGQVGEPSESLWRAGLRGQRAP